MYMLTHRSAQTHTNNKNNNKGQGRDHGEKHKEFLFLGNPLLEIKRKTLKITFNMF